MTAAILATAASINGISPQARFGSDDGTTKQEERAEEPEQRPSLVRSSVGSSSADPKAIVVCGKRQSLGTRGLKMRSASQPPVRSKASIVKSFLRPSSSHSISNIAIVEGHNEDDDDGDDDDDVASFDGGITSSPDAEPQFTPTTYLSDRSHASMSRFEEASDEHQDATRIRREVRQRPSILAAMGGRRRKSGPFKNVFSRSRRVELGSRKCLATTRGSSSNLASGEEEEHQQHGRFGLLPLMKGIGSFAGASQRKSKAQRPKTASTVTATTKESTNTPGGSAVSSLNGDDDHSYMVSEIDDDSGSLGIGRKQMEEAPAESESQQPAHLADGDNPQEHDDDDDVDSDDDAAILAAANLLGGSSVEISERSLVIPTDGKRRPSLMRNSVTQDPMDPKGLGLRGKASRTFSKATTNVMESVSALEEEATHDVDLLLAQTRPKHVLEGFSNGIGHVVAGTAGAVGVLVCSPFTASQAGYRHGGVVGGALGAVIGTGVGAVAAPAMAVGGIVSGVNQVIQGVANTPAAVVGPTQGKWWNVQEGRWVLTRLQTETKAWLEAQPQFDEDILGSGVIPALEELNGLQPDQAANGENHALQIGVMELERYQNLIGSDEGKARAARYDVEETYLYDILGVDPDATGEQIERRYTQDITRKFSSNRSGADTPKARATMARIGKAYVILSNDTLRSFYNQAGLEAIYPDPEEFFQVSLGPGAGKNRESTYGGGLSLDPVALFGQLFGARMFNPCIGRLTLLTEALVIESDSKVAAFPEEMAGVNLGQARLMQKRRVSRLALQLAEWLDLYAEFHGTEIGKRTKARVRQAWLEEQTQSLCRSDCPYFGQHIAALIGSVYCVCAEQFLGSLESGLGMPSIHQWAKRQQINLVRTEKEVVHQAQELASMDRYMGGSNTTSVHGDSNRSHTQTLRNTMSEEVRAKAAGHLQAAQSDSQRRRLAEYYFEKHYQGQAQTKAVPGETHNGKRLSSAANQRLLERLWNQVAADVTVTLHETAQMVLMDQDIPSESRRLRGEALGVMGEVMAEAVTASKGQEPSVSLEAQEDQHRELSRIAFYAVLENMRRQETATRQAYSSRDLFASSNEDWFDKDASATYATDAMDSFSER